MMAGFREPRRHFAKSGITMEPDPEHPGGMRTTTWCPTCVNDDADSRWPCEVERIRVAAIEQGRRQGEEIVWDRLATAIWNVHTKVGVPGLMIRLHAEYDRLRGAS
jgi:hypothetical protein